MCNKNQGNFTARLCNKDDCNVWIELNRAFMKEEIQDDELWNDTSQADDECFAKTFINGLETPERVKFLLFEENGVPVGFANLMIIFSVWTHGLAVIIDDLYLTPECRGKGYGRKSMEIVEQYAEDEGCKRIQFQSELTNPNAMEFYMALGYTPADMKFYVKYFNN